MKKLRNMFRDIFFVLFILITILIPDILIFPYISGWWSHTSELHGMIYDEKLHSYNSEALLNPYYKTSDECSDKFCHIMEYKDKSGLYVYDLIGLRLTNRFNCGNQSLIWNNIPYLWGYILSLSTIIFEIVLILLSTVLYLINSRAYFQKLNNLSFIVFLITNFCLFILRICQILYFRNIIKSQQVLYLCLQSFLIISQFIIIITHKHIFKFFTNNKLEPNIDDE